MRKKALKKDFHREIRKSLNRFLSIFFIVAMGVAFYSGIQSSAPDMLLTGDYYFNESNLMDLRVVGTMGLTEDDMEALRQVEGIEAVEPGYMTDVLCGQGETQKVLHVETLSETMNQVSVHEGRLPEKGGECFVDKDFMSKAGYQVGDRIELIVPEEEEAAEEAEDGETAEKAEDGGAGETAEEETEEEKERETEKETEEEDETQSSGMLRRVSYEIVGSGSSSAYLSHNRGSSSLGNGEVDGFLYILPEDFDSEVYTVAYLTVAGARELTAYSDEYQNLVDQTMERVEAIENVRCEARYQEVVEEAQEKLDEYRQKLKDGESELAEAESELESGKAEAESELAEAKEELESGESELESGKQELQDSRKELEDAKQQIADGEAQLAEKQSQLDSARQQLAAGETQVSAAESQLQEKQNQYDSSAASAQKKLDQGQSELDQAQDTLNQNKKTLESESSRLDQAESELNAAADELAASRKEYEAGAAQIDVAEQAYAQQKAALDQQQQEYDAQAAALQQGKQAYDAGMGQLTQLQNGKDAAAAQAAEYRGQAESLTAQNSGLQSQISEKNGTISTLSGEIAGLAQQIAQLEGQLAGETDETRQQEIKDQITALQGAKAEKEGQKNTLEGEVAALNGTISSNQSAISQAEAAAQEAEGQAAQLAASISELSVTLEAKKTELDAAEQQLAAGKSQLDAYSQKLAEGRTELDQQTAALNQAKTALETGESELAANQAQVSQGRQQLAAGQQQLEAGQKEIDANQKEIDAGRKELSDARSQLASGWSQINESKSQLASSRAQVEDGARQLSEGWQTLSDSRTEVSDGEQKLSEAQEEIEENEQKLKDGWKEYEDGKKEAEDEIKEGEDKIADAREELDQARADLQETQDKIDEIEKPKWYVSDRSVWPDYTGYGENAERLTNIGKVFPVLFFLVAALISLTTMTRMVEEERTQIGTMKALGYSKADIAGKYMKYALYATLGGSVAGILVGEKILPYIIIYAYGMMYQHLPYILIPYNWNFGLLATVAALVCTLGATFSACWKELASTPAVLMRPPAPKEGKRVWLEYLTFLWKRLSFTWKSTIRNLFRYKKRFFMTIVGIGGCMGLLLVGFGLNDSIMGIASLQYGDLQHYDIMLVLDEGADEPDKQDLEKRLDENRDISLTKKMFAKKVTAASGKKEYTPYLYVPENTEDLEQILTLRDRMTRESYTLTDEGAIITEKLANMLDLEVGDEITLSDDDQGEIRIPITHIAENYLYHYIYLTPALYEKIYGEAPEYNSILLLTETKENQEIQKIGQDLLESDAVINVSYTGTIAGQLEDMLASLDIVIAVLIISAGMLAFVVLYNLNNININERRRELATLKVLGFYDGEVSTYVFRENILLTVIGAAAGCLFGIFLHRFIIVTVEVDACMFGRNINGISFVYGVLFTFGFSAFVNLVMHFQLKKIDMVESLKSVE